MGYYQPVINGYINAMLELRNQKLKEQLAQDEGMQQLGKGIGSMVGQLGQGIGAMAQQGQQDALVNQIATNPEQSWLGGGTDEMAIRLKMQDMKNEQMRAQAYQDQVGAQRAKYDIDQATQAWNQTDKKLDQAYKERTAYIKEDSLLDNALSKAEDPAAYKAAADKKVALNQAAMDRGLKGVEPLAPDAIPPFMTPQEKEQLALQRQSVADAQQAIGAAQAEPAGMWDQIRSSIGLKPESNVLGIPVTFDSERAINAAQAKFKQEQETLSGMKGADYKAPAPAAPAASAATGATSQFPVGHKQVHPQTGKTRTWDGEKWVYGQ